MLPIPSWPYFFCPLARLGLSGQCNCIAAAICILAGTAAAAGIGIVNSVGNLGGYFGPNIPIWAQLISSDPSAALYIIAGILMIRAGLTYFFIPKTLRIKVST